MDPKRIWKFSQRPPCNAVNTKRLSFRCPVMIVTIFLGWPQKINFRPKNRVFGPQKGHFGQLGPRNGLPSGQMTTNQKTKHIQSYLRIWETYDPIESGPSEPKKWGLYRRSVEKCRFSDQKWAQEAAPRHAVQRGLKKCCLLGVQT